MMPDILAQDSFQFGGKGEGFSFANLIIPAVGVLLTLAVIFILYVIYLTYARSKQKDEEWVQFSQMLEELKLNREEASFLTRSIKRMGYKEPSKVLRKQDLFERFSKKMLKRPNHHTEFLLATIRQKAFEGKK